MLPTIFVKEITVANGAVDTEVEMGFVPDYAKVTNQMAATTEITMWEWAPTMPDLGGIKHTFDGGCSYVATGGHISKLDTRTVQTTDPVQITKKQGIKIAAAFHDTDDVITVIGFRSDVGD